MLKLCVCDTCAEGFVGASVTTMGRTGGGAAVTVIVVEADWVLSLTEAAVMMLVAGLGGDAGAVYVTEVAVTLVSVPQALPLQPESDQVTPLFCVSF